MNASRRVAVGAAIGVVTLAVAMLLTPWQVAILAGWDVTAASFLVSVWLDVRGKDSAATKAMCTREDNSPIAADTILLAAGIASLAGVAFALVKAAGEQGWAHAGILAVAILSVLLSWASVHCVFTLRYARLYYSGGGGIDFHSKDLPDYGDFAYVALTLGMTFQVSDTDLVSKRIRMTALRHALISYLFGVVVVAVTINVVAGLFAK